MHRLLLHLNIRVPRELRFAACLFFSWLLGIITTDLRPQPREELEVLEGVPESEAALQILPKLLQGEALRHLDARKELIESFSSPVEVKNRQRYIRERLLQAVGPFPPAGPLNARTTGTLERDGYHIEKILFETEPRFYVTANLYVPERGQGRFPGILMPLGHEHGGKANPDWQHLAVTFARNGFVVLAYDPIGQAERIQLYDPALGASKVLHSTTEHTLAGVQCLLLGHSFVRHRIWDGMRALDYLLSRPEVDPQRIGCTGNSGGGTMTAHLAALEDRIKVAVPSCYITSWRELLKTIGPQDAEQSTPPFLADELDHGDLLIAFAPKPVLIASAIQDFFSIEGARRTFHEVSRVYSLLNADESIDMVEADDGHGFTLPRRLAAYRWMSRWLKGEDKAIPEPGIEVELEEDLNCTESGQVSISLNSRSVFDLHVGELRQIRRPAAVPGDSDQLGDFKTRITDQVVRLTHYRPPSGPFKVRHFGQIGRPGYRIEKLVFESSPGVLVPSLLFVPHGAQKFPGIVYTDEDGKSGDAQPGGDIEDLVLGGNVVLAIDLLGWGETEPLTPPQRRTDFFRYFGDYDNAMTAFLVNETLVGMRVSNIEAAVQVLRKLPEVDRSNVGAVGKGASCVPLLHAAVLDDSLQKIWLENMLIAFRTVIEEKVHWKILEQVVPGVLQHYDLPDLATALAPRELAIVNARDPRGRRLPLSQTTATYQRTRQVYAILDAESSVRVMIRKPGKNLSLLWKEAFEPRPAGAEQ